MTSATSAPPADAATASNGASLPHPGAFPALVPSTTASATPLPGVDGPLGRPSASAVPDLNAIPEDAALPSGPLTSPTISAASALPDATANGGPPHHQPAAARPSETVDGGQAAPAQHAEQRSQPALANGYLLQTPGAEATTGSLVTADPPAKAPAGSTAAPGEPVPLEPAAGAAAAASAAQPGSGPGAAAEATQQPDGPDAASADAAGAAARPSSTAGGAAQDAPQYAAPAVAAQQPDSAAEHGGAGTVAAAEAAAMVKAERAVAVEEAMEVRRGIGFVFRHIIVISRVLV